MNHSRRVNLRGRRRNITRQLVKPTLRMGCRFSYNDAHPSRDGRILYRFNRVATIGTMRVNSGIRCANLMEIPHFPHLPQKKMRSEAAHPKNTQLHCGQTTDTLQACIFTFWRAYPERVFLPYGKNTRQKKNAPYAIVWQRYYITFSAKSQEETAIFRHFELTKPKYGSIIDGSVSI